MYRHDNGSDYSGNIHHAKDIESPFAWPTLMDRLKHGYLFSVVRNPEARAVSGFFDFFVTARNREAAKHHPYAGKFGILKHDALTNRFDAFLDYVGAALDADPLETDRHFRPQHLNLGHDHIELSYVARVEQLENDLREIGVQTGMNLLDEQDPKPRRRNVSGSDAFQITAQQRAKIEAMFAKDYEIYGY